MNWIRANRMVNHLIVTGKQSLVTNAGYLMGIGLLNALIGFLFWGIAARLCPPEDVGFTSAVVSAAFLVCGLTDFGMSIGLVRYLPESRTPIKFLNTIFSFDALTSILAGIVYLAGISLWTSSLAALQRNWIYIAEFIIYVSFFTLSTILSRAFIAKRKSIYALYLNTISNGSRLIFLILFVRLWGSTGLFTSLTLSYVLATALCLMIFLPKAEPGYRVQLDIKWSILKNIFPYSVGNYVVGLFSMVYQRLIPILVIELLGAVSSGHFYIAWMIGSVLGTPSTAFSDASFAEGSNLPERLKTQLKQSLAIGLGLTIPAAIIVGLGSHYILLLIGTGYAQEASNLLRLLAISAPLSLITNLYFTSLRVTKKIKELILVNAFLASATLGITYGLIHQLGITAFGIGYLIGNSITCLVAVISLGWYKDLIQLMITKNKFAASR